jgi:spectinomycin phosphotransferase
MLERPPIPDERIGSAMQVLYGLASTRITFLPMGYDVNTAIFRVEGRDGKGYFLKLRKGAFSPITVSVPQFLGNMGVKGIIYILNTRKGNF